MSMFDKKKDNREVPRTKRRVCGISVEQLRKAMADLPDDAEVLLSIQGGPEGRFEIINVGRNPDKPVHRALWGDKFQTREVHNAYRANDDRYDGPVLLIEVGEESP